MKLYFKKRNLHSILMIALLISCSSESSFAVLPCNSLLLKVSEKVKKINIDHILDGLNPFSIFRAKIMGVSHDQLAPPEFFTADEKGIVVGINGVTKDQMYLEVADFMSGKEWVQPGKVYQSRAKHLKDFISKLLLAYQTGGPISKLVIVAHGLPGRLMIGGFLLNSEWVSINEDYLKQLPKDLFAKDAIVVLISCSTARVAPNSNEDGVKDLKTIFTPLLKNGGTVIASTRYVDPQLSKIPKQYKNYLERLKRHLLYLPLGTLIDLISWLDGDVTTMFKKVIAIPISPQETTQSFEE